MSEKQPAFWVVYEHGEPHGIRSRDGFVCFFRAVTKFAGQEDRYKRELKQRQEYAELMAKALSERTDRDDHGNN